MWMTKTCVTVGPESTVRLRQLNRSDIPSIRHLCQQWFPIDYPDQWYKDITSGSRFFSLAAVIGDEIVGLIVSQIKPQCRCNAEDRDLVGRGFGPEPLVAYILSLGVVSEKRRSGIGSLLLRSLIQYLTNNDMTSGCKAVFLHVLCSNTEAIRFYESQKFVRHKFLPLYYLVGDRCMDAFTYVRYINQGRPQITCSLLCNQVLSFCSHVSSLTLSGFRHSLRLLFATRFQRILTLPKRLTHGAASRLLKSSPKSSHITNA